MITCLFPFKFYKTKIELNEPFFFDFANIRGLAEQKKTRSQAGFQNMLGSILHFQFTIDVFNVNLKLFVGFHQVVYGFNGM